MLGVIKCLARVLDSSDSVRSAAITVLAELRLDKVVPTSPVEKNKYGLVVD